jgi:general secretion pathway protein N
MIWGRHKQQRWVPTVDATHWADSTHAELSWDRSRHAGTRWAWAGAFTGALVALIWFAPASWLAAAVNASSQQQLLLTQARGTVWSGSAAVVLTGGPGSRDASSLPGRMEWTLGLHGLGFELQARHACCLNGTVAVQVKPGLGRWQLTLVPSPAWAGQWPSALLGGLGTPWNTLQLGGMVRLVSPNLKLEWVKGRWLVDGRADLEWIDVSARVSTLETLGSYRLSLNGDAANPGVSLITLSTQSGALQLSGEGTWGPAGVRFRGEATSAPNDQAALSNLLNIIGRRDGARSVITIG